MNKLVIGLTILLAVIGCAPASSTSTEDSVASLARIYGERANKFEALKAEALDSKTWTGKERPFDLDCTVIDSGNQYWCGTGVMSERDATKLYETLKSSWNTAAPNLTWKDGEKGEDVLFVGTEPTAPDKPVVWIAKSLVPAIGQVRFIVYAPN